MYAKFGENNGAITTVNATSLGYKVREANSFSWNRTESTMQDATYLGVHI